MNGLNVGSKLQKPLQQETGFLNARLFKRRLDKNVNRKFYRRRTMDLFIWVPWHDNSGKHLNLFGGKEKYAAKLNENLMATLPS